MDCAFETLDWHPAIDDEDDVVDDDDDEDDDEEDVVVVDHKIRFVSC